ncbi:p-cumate 2,3-dioxygenase system, small oxygenase component (plasmid) [Sphingobium sp. AntQ-1]|uniref:aromatic-ring-hydroxylating dioxygenase subunit beta n=1 Tax=Sphingobium sp. AntQ-1 TaxID=2930091 RepID=UPI00234F3FAD|nr:aromatic-ring-hydroxylating dioxygenase subunit beta [Sphingobium sp. AntQ-1]WCP15970.1 p-cumate 2,3-dioxygenase system, small oxygenase component [Sphingobium sp. AntQ-1]
MSVQNPAIGPDLARSIEQFLYREALYMDEHRYRDWFDMLHDDMLYWVPCNAADGDPRQMTSIIYERKPQINERLRRLEGGTAYAQSPRSALVRIVSNIVIEACGDDSATVSSTFSLGEWRPTREVHWFGRTRYRLTRSGDDWKILEKKVVLMNNDAFMPNMTFLV